MFKNPFKRIFEKNYPPLSEEEIKRRDEYNKKETKRRTVKSLLFLLFIVLVFLIAEAIRYFVK